MGNYDTYNTLISVTNYFDTKEEEETGVRDLQTILRTLVNNHKTSSYDMTTRLRNSCLV